MKLTLSKEELGKIVSDVSRAVPVKSVDPILGYVYLSIGDDGSYKAIGSNGNLSIVEEGKLKEDASGIKGGTILLYPQAINAILSKLGNLVSLSTSSNGELTITDNNAKFTLKTKDAQEYPNVYGSIDTPTLSFALPFSVYSELYDSTAFAAAKNSYKKAFEGIQVKTSSNGYLSFTATDAMKLAFQSAHVDGKLLDASIVVPVESLKAVYDLASGAKNISFVSDSQHAVMSFGETKVISRLYNGGFPDVSGILPKERNIDAKFSTKSLLDALGTISALPSGSNAVSLVTIDGTGKLSSTSLFGTATQTVPIDNVGTVKQFSLTLDAEFLKGFLKATLSDSVSLVSEGERKIVQVDGFGYDPYDAIGVVAPIRKNQ